MDDIVAWEQFSIRESIHHLIVHRQDGLALVGLEFLQTDRAKEMIAENPDVTIAPECAAHHQVLKQRESGEV